MSYNSVHPKESQKKQNRLGEFVKFFQGYMSSLALITAFIPVLVPLTKAIPTFKQQTTLFAVSSSLFCFLLLGFIFSERHTLAKGFYPIPNPSKKFSMGQKGWHWLLKVAPACLIFASLLSVFKYHKLLNWWVGSIRNDVTLKPLDSITYMYFSANSTAFDIYAVNERYVLDNFHVSPNPLTATYLLVYYMGIFVFAGAAFMLMAVKEHLQNILDLDDVAMINGAEEQVSTTVLVQ